MDVYNTSDVFGLSREVPLNYVAREEVDVLLTEYLALDKHVIVHGSSKQGKTCLRKQCIGAEESIVVTCSNKWDLGDLNSAILKRAGFEITLSEKKSASGAKKVSATLGVEWLAKLGISGEKSTESGEEVTRAPLELDPLDVNDIIRALSTINFAHYIILEDFHYLSLETQRDFSIALKAFHENSRLSFVIIGVWLEDDRLTVYNGDLSGRTISVSADEWSDPQLLDVIRKGEDLLNVEFEQGFRTGLVTESRNNVYIVQEACRRVCDESGVHRTAAEAVRIASTISPRDLVRGIVDQQSARYQSFLTQFADGFQETELEMYRWVLFPVLTAPEKDLLEGLRLKAIRDILREEHPRGDGLNTGNITQALHYCANLQIKKNILPLVLDYDGTNLRLRVVDKAFLIWLSYQDRTELLDLVGVNG